MLSFSSFFWAGTFLHNNAAYKTSFLASCNHLSLLLVSTLIVIPFSLFSFQFQDFRFLCPNDTVFDQQNLVCTNWFEVDCQQSVALFLSDFGTKKLTTQGCL